METEGPRKVINVRIIGLNHPARGKTYPLVTLGGGLEVRHTQTFEFSAQQCWDLLASEKVQAEIAAAAGITIEPIETKQNDRGQTRRYRVVPHDELPAVAAKALGSPRFTYVQTDILDNQARLLTWSIQPDQMGDRIRASGRITLSDKPNGHCERKLFTEISVAIPLIGRKIEKLVIQNLAGSHERTAQVLQTWGARNQGLV